MIEEAKKKDHDLRWPRRTRLLRSERPTSLVSASDCVDEEWMFHRWGDVKSLDLRADVYKGGTAPSLGEDRAIDESYHPTYRRRSGTLSQMQC